MEKRKIYFDENLHKYTDELGNIYTSTTTLISKYYDHFNADEVATNCERIGRSPYHKDYLKYKGKSKKQILTEWAITRETALDKGTRKHNYFETAIRQSTGYKLVNNIFINDRIYTIDDVIGDRKIGLISIEQFESMGIKERYPIIFDVIYKLTQAGYLIYAEIGTYDSDNLISGLVDVLLIRGWDFIIIDWKTNADIIKFESGYFKKDRFNNRTDEFVRTDEYFNYPIEYLPSSVGHKYSLQVSGYAEQIEQFGFTFRGAILFHIRSITTGMISKINNQENEEVNVVEVRDLRREFKKIKEHHYNINHYKNPNLTLF